MKTLLYLFVFCITFLHVSAQCSYSQFPYTPKELLRKRVKDNEPGFRYGNPYSMFNRQNHENWNLNNDLEKIRSRIILGSTSINSDTIYRYFYSQIWEAANKHEPAKCGERSTKCPHAAWVKNNAVIYMVGLGYKQIDDEVHFWQLSQDSINLYAQRVKTGLQTV